MSPLPDMPRLNRRFRMQWEEAQQAHVLLYPEGMVRLNQSAGEILKRCDGATTVDDIVLQLEQQFNTSGLRNDVLDMLAHALEKDWIA
jgi:pyrroloquinoline quinone biosynthesis protein D